LSFELGEVVEPFLGLEFDGEDGLPWLREEDADVGDVDEVK
jgi:hypothetical protein